jgi:glutamyl-tRNA synthetase
MEIVRTRFAPSPTGYLHIGGARTALYNWLISKKNNGVFILRIEDTDKERSTKEAMDAILDGMKWLGLDWNEGPFYQTQRFDLYKQYLKKLIDKKLAYPCFCSAEELEEKRKKAMASGQKPKYDGKCRDLANPPMDQPHVYRLRVPDSGKTIVKDLIKGEIIFDNSELDDLVLARSDGTPTYNFTVVVDDIEMGITDVIRGDDHLNNTPKQIIMYKAFEKEPPRFAHLPLILGEDKKRLSKRHGATSVQSYREMGYLPEAVVNFLARIGWAHKDDEIFSIDELVQKFSLEGVGKSAGVFNEEKLLWINQHYIKNCEAERILEELKRWITITPDKIKGDGWKKVIDSLRERSKTLVEMANLSKFYFCDEVEFDEKAKEKFLTKKIEAPFRDLTTRIVNIADLNEQALKSAFDEVAKQYSLKLGDIAQPVRVSMTGGTVSPGIFETMEMIGKDRVEKRLKGALKIIENS